MIIITDFPFPSYPSPVHWLNTTPIDSTDVPCTIDDLRVHAHVSGLYAEVSETLTIRNPNPRPISTDIEIALPDAAVVCGYALEIDGKLIDGVIVPKEAARIAFETERRRGADPGLVEAIRGNLYKTRVYPVPANGTRQIRLSYITPLALDAQGNASTELPLPAESVAHRHIKIDIDMPDSPRPVITGLGDGSPKEMTGIWTIEHDDGDIAATEPIRVGLPSIPEPLVMVERDAQGDLWFLASDSIPDAEGEKACEITSVTIIWDASGSRAGIDHGREMELATAYCSGKSIQDIKLMTFSNTVGELETCSSVEELAGKLSSTRYDGGTDLSALSSALADIPGASDGASGGNLLILFTDGIDTLSTDGLSLPDGCDMLVITSGKIRDLEGLSQACRRHAYDLMTAPSDADALAMEFSPAMSFRRLAVTGTGIADVCDAGFGGSNRRVAIGRLTSEATTIRLGDGGQELRIDAASAHDGSTIALAWAARRVSLLSPQAGANESELMRIGRRFGIASPVSSLLVLETLDQWLRYEIEPPKSWEEMWTAWHQAQPGRMQLETDDSRKANHIRAVEHQWETLLAWHKKDFPYQPDGSMAQGPSGTTIQTPPDRMARTRFARQFVADDRVASMGIPADASPERREGLFTHFCSIGARMRRSSHMEARSAGSSYGSPMATPHANFAFDEGGAYAEDFACNEEYDDTVASDATATLDSFSIDDAPSQSQPPMTASVNLRAWAPDAPYLKRLDEVFDKANGRDIEEARNAYMEMREENHASPSFFLDCSEWFISHGDLGLGLRIVSNLAELDVDEPALLRVLGWRLREAGELRQARAILGKVLSLRGEDSQSHRDVAILLSEMAKESHAMGRHDEARRLLAKAADHYRTVATTPWSRRAVAVSLFAVEELNVLRAWASSVEWEGEVPEIAPVTERLEGVLDCDIRITLAWDADDTDVDIHVTEPSGEEAYYAHPATYSGGRVSEDITDGYGPELYEIRKAQEGEYVIRAHYFASHQQTIFGPATCTLTIYTDWGRPNQSQRITTTRLDKERTMISVGKIRYGDVTAPSDGSDGSKEGQASDGKAHPYGHLSIGMDEAEIAKVIREPDKIRQAGDGTRTLIWDETGGRKVCALIVDGRLQKVFEQMPWGDEMIILQ